MYVIVCYDISSHRRRARLHEELLGFGTPVQRSVFECQLTPGQFRRLQQRCQRYARGPNDTIRYYLLCRQCQARTAKSGTPLAEEIAEGEDYRVS